MNVGQTASSSAKESWVLESKLIPEKLNTMHTNGMYGAWLFRVLNLHRRSNSIASYSTWEDARPTPSSPQPIKCTHSIPNRHYLRYFMWCDSHLELLRCSQFTTSELILKISEYLWQCVKHTFKTDLGTVRTTSKALCEASFSNSLRLPYHPPYTYLSMTEPRGEARRNGRIAWRHGESFRAPTPTSRARADRT